MRQGNWEFLETPTFPTVISRENPIRKDATRIFDEKGLAMWEGKFYHPYVLARHGRWYVEKFIKSKRQEYLDKAVLHANKLLELSTTYDDGLYFMYQVDFILHKSIIGDKDGLKAPWFSGMAQAAALAFFSKLGTIYSRYNLIIENIFLSLQKQNPLNVVDVDSDGYYWVNEYPILDERALNGFIFALFDLHTFWSITKNPIAKVYLSAGILTVKKNIQKYSNKPYSYYCLRHKLPNKKYHNIHLEQLSHLALITKDDSFYEFLK